MAGFTARMLYCVGTRCIPVYSELAWWQARNGSQWLLLLNNIWRLFSVTFPPNDQLSCQEIKWFMKVWAGFVFVFFFFVNIFLLTNGGEHCELTYLSSFMQPIEIKLLWLKLTGASEGQQWKQNGGPNTANTYFLFGFALLPPCRSKERKACPVQENPLLPSAFKSRCFFSLKKKKKNTHLCGHC